MKQTDPQMKIRLPPALKAEIEQAATDNNRSMNAEIVARLKESFTSLSADAVKFAHKFIELLLKKAVEHANGQEPFHPDVKALLEFISRDDSSV